LRIAQHLAGTGILQQSIHFHGLDNYFVDHAMKLVEIGGSIVNEHVAVMGGLSDRRRIYAAGRA
jgi:hypothetical protein